MVASSWPTVTGFERPKCYGSTPALHVANGEWIHSPTREAQAMATGAYINQDDQGHNFGAVNHFEISCHACRISKDGSLHMARLGTVTTL